MRNWYDVLGVRPDASSEEVRATYRLHARALHPDSRDPSLPPAEADAALRLLNQAWEVLRDPVRRAEYDATLEDLGVPADEETWSASRFHGRGFPWWIVVLAVLLVIFVFTAYAATPTAPPQR